MKIVLAIDFSAPSEVAVGEFVARPWPSGTTVHILHVIDIYALTESIGYSDTFINKEKEEAEALSNSVAIRLRSHGLEATPQIVEGYPSTGIVDYAAKWDADFVFVGSHGHGGIVGFLLGSVARFVVHNAHCSVEVVRVPRRTGAMRILLATDGSEYSLAAMRSVAGRPWPQESEFKIVSVVDSVGPTSNPRLVARELAARARVENTKFAQEAVDAAQKILADAGLKAAAQVLVGNPKRRIVEEAKEWGASLVVAGSRGRRGMERLLLGSVSEAIVTHAPCSIEVIRARARNGN